MKIILNKSQLAEELVDFCVKYKILSMINEVPKSIEMKENVVNKLKCSEFVEGFIHLLITSPKLKNNIDKRKLKELLLSLEKIKLELEYGEEW